MAKQKDKKRNKITLSGMERDRLRYRSYDAAATTRHTELHFLHASSLDADSLVRADITVLRNRSRYEVRNNCYASGIVDTLANDLIGTGPRLQVVSDHKEVNNHIEDLFEQWCLTCDIENRMNFKEILRLVGAWQQCESGEAFITLENAKPATSWLRVKAIPTLRLRVVEPDRIASPNLAMLTDKFRDGIEYDDDGRPVKYYVLKRHPGSSLYYQNVLEYDTVDADHMIHLYHQKRAGQSRGVPWLTPSLPLFANLRRFTLATIQGAETAANISATLKQQPAGTSEFEDEIESMDEVEIPRNAMLTLPANTEMQQFKPEQPSTTYKDFKREILNEIARGVNMPFNVAAANSADYNYASGRLDWQVYFRFIKTIRSWLQDHVCDRVFYTWLKEAVFMPNTDLRMVDLRDIKTQWFWPGSEHVDPLKEAKAQEARLKSMTSNLSAEYAMVGLDWEREIKQRAKEIEMLKELGVYDDLMAQQKKQQLGRQLVPAGA